MIDEWIIDICTSYQDDHWPESVRVGKWKQFKPNSYLFSNYSWAHVSACIFDRLSITPDRYYLMDYDKDPTDDCYYMYKHDLFHGIIYNENIKKMTLRFGRDKIILSQHDIQKQLASQVNVNVKYINFFKEPVQLMDFHYMDMRIYVESLDSNISNLTIVSLYKTHDASIRNSFNKYASVHDIWYGTRGGVACNLEYGG
jgi:hypothetical protein